MNVQVIGTLPKSWDRDAAVIESQDQLSKLFLDVFGAHKIAIPTQIDFSKRNVVVFAHTSPPPRDVSAMLVAHETLDLEYRTMDVDKGRREHVTLVSIPKEFVFKDVCVSHVVSKNPEDFSTELQDLKHLIEDLEWKQVTDPSERQRNELDRLRNQYSCLADKIINAIP